MIDAAVYSDPSVDIDCLTGGNISGWPQVVQSIGQIFHTRFGERVMREWFGSMVPALLGENLNQQTIIKFFTAVGAAIEQWEPRFRTTRIVPLSVDRAGHFSVLIEGEFRPRALLGDVTPHGARRVTATGSNQGLRLSDE